MTSNLMLEEKKKRPDSKREDEGKNVQNRGEGIRNLERVKGKNQQ